MTTAELESFYESIVLRARARGTPCAITSGMACVHYGVAQTTKDCDVLCPPDAADLMLGVVGEANLAGATARYRGHLSPPLDSRWLQGGWTSHFEWGQADAQAYLDVFGIPPRTSSPWEPEVNGLFAHPHTVGEMKRTNRDKDWPFATALGVKLLKAGDARGWCHIFGADVLSQMVAEFECPAEIIARRPVLQLALGKDRRLRGALHAELMFWHELDRVRMQVYRRALRPYVVAMGRARIPMEADFVSAHRARLVCAEAALNPAPLRDFGFDHLLAETLAGTEEILGTRVYFDWLPDVRDNFMFLLS